MSNVLLSILIPVGNDAVGLEVTLASLKAVLSDKDDIEVIICNDGGGSVISDVVSSYGYLEVELRKNAGSYAARNAGLLRSRGSLIAFIDADERVDPGWLDAGLAAMCHHDYVGGRIMIETKARAGFWERVDRANAFPVDEYISRLQFAPTANLWVKREVLRVAGCFDGSLRSGGDFEFGRRVASAGFDQAYCPSLIAHHPARGLWQQLRKTRRVAYGNAQLNVCVWRKPGWSLFRGTLKSIARSAYRIPSRAWREFADTRSPGRYFRARLAAATHTLKLIYGLWLLAFMIVLMVGRRKHASAIVRLGGPADSPAGRLA